MRPKNKIYIYNGLGTNELGCLQAAHTFSSLYPDLQVIFIDSGKILESNWEENAALFIMPGGADLPYGRLLNGKGNQKIKRFVQEGGAYLGLCAGSYYAGSFVEFAKGEDTEVMGERELSLFPGAVRGPVFPPYIYNSFKGGQALLVSWHAY